MRTEWTIVIAVVSRARQADADACLFRLQPLVRARSRYPAIARAVAAQRNRAVRATFWGGRRARNTADAPELARARILQARARACPPRRPLPPGRTTRRR